MFLTPLVSLFHISICILVGLARCRGRNTEGEQIDSLLVSYCDNENLTGIHVFDDRPSIMISTTSITLLDLTPVLKQLKLPSGRQKLRHPATSPMVSVLSSSWGEALDLLLLMPL
jgi:hypothetical protein